MFDSIAQNIVDSIDIQSIVDKQFSLVGLKHYYYTANNDLECPELAKSYIESFNGTCDGIGFGTNPPIPNWWQLFFGHKDHYIALYWYYRIHEKKDFPPNNAPKNFDADKFKSKIHKYLSNNIKKEIFKEVQDVYKSP